MHSPRAYSINAAPSPRNRARSHLAPSLACQLGPLFLFPWWLENPTWRSGVVDGGWGGWERKAGGGDDLSWMWLVQVEWQDRAEKCGKSSFFSVSSLVCAPCSALGRVE